MVNIYFLSIIILLSSSMKFGYGEINFKNTKNKPSLGLKSGQIVGRWRTSFEGYQYAAFEGIPYAKPPVGDLRFQPPQPVEPWSGIWKATELKECLQIPIGSGSKIKGSEDCLYVNVFIPAHDGSEKLDVLVHIHGGGFTEGSGTSFVEPFHMMLRKWVFVTFNYRLGPLGFLSTEDHVVPGNNGLKDQVLALKWIKDNIAEFGGNPNSITLTGFSAGAAATHLHYLSPLSKNLFNRGFSISGSALNPWVITEQPLKLTKTLAKALNCKDSSDSSKMVDCMRKKSGEDIIKKTNEIVNKFEIAPFGVVIENKHEDAFLSENPLKLLENGEVYDVPWICSHTTEEGLGYYWFFMNQLEKTGVNLNTALKSALEIEGKVSEEMEDTVFKRIVELYLPNGTEVESANRNNYIKLFSDRLNSIDVEDAIELHARATTSPVYHYKFAFNNGANSIQKMFTKKKIKGACHGDDMVYLFGGVITKSLTSIETRLKMAMQKMMSTYAHTGIPTLGEIDWPPVTNDEFNYIQIVGSDTFRSKIKTDFSMNTFWRNVFLQDFTKDEL